MDTNSGKKHNVKLSKSLSWLLRHNLDLIYAYLSSDNEKEVAETSGFVDCQAILRHPRFSNYTIEQIQEVCSLNDKQRFTIRQHPDNPQKLQIRANQGHTIKTVKKYEKGSKTPFHVPWSPALHREHRKAFILKGNH